MATLVTLSPEQLDLITGGRRRSSGQRRPAMGRPPAGYSNELVERLNRSSDEQMAAFETCLHDAKGDLLKANPGHTRDAVCLDRLAP